MKISKQVIDAMEYAGGTDYRWDDSLPNFGIRLYPSGRKAFVISYRVKGRKRIMVLGAYGVLTLHQAREKARKALVQVAEGEDPSGQRQAQLDSPTMQDLATRYMTDHAPKKKASSVKEDRRMWDQHILPRLGSRKVADISREDIDRLHSRMRKTRYAANRTLALLSKAFNLAEVWGWRPDASNPCRHVKPFKEERRERYLSLAEIARLGKVLDTAEREGSELPGVIATIRLLLLTGCRLNEILTLRWADVDLPNACLHLVDSKTGRRDVLLSSAAVQVLANIERSADNPHVIQGAHRGKHLVNISKPWKRLKEQAGIEDVRPHDLRHTFASIGVTAGFSLPMVGKSLGHSNTATTERYAHLADDPVRTVVERIGNEIAGALE